MAPYHHRPHRCAVSVKSKRKDMPHSTSLGSYGGIEILLTPQNTVFIIFRKEVYWPFLHSKTGVLMLDARSVLPLLSAKAKTKLKEVLDRQAEVRKQQAGEIAADELASEFEG